MVSSDKDVDALLNAMSSSQGSSFLHKLLFLISGIGVSLLPVVLYVSPMFDLTFEEHGTQFIFFGVLSGLALSKAYGAVASKKRLILLSQREPASSGKKEKSDGVSTYEAATTREAVSYALFATNLAYLASFLIFAFYVSVSIPVRYNHIVSVVLPAAALSLQGSAVLT